MRAVLNQRNWCCHFVQNFARKFSNAGSFFRAKKTDCAQMMLRQWAYHEGHAILGQNVSYWKIPKNYSGIYVFKPVLKGFNGLKQITWYWKSIEEIKRYWKSIEMIAMVLKVFNGIEQGLNGFKSVLKVFVWVIMHELYLECSDDKNKNKHILNYSLFSNKNHPMNKFAFERFDRIQIMHKVYSEVLNACAPGCQICKL